MGGWSGAMRCRIILLCDISAILVQVHFSVSEIDLRRAKRKTEDGVVQFTDEHVGGSKP